MICTPKSGHESVCFLYLRSKKGKIISLTNKFMSKRIFTQEQINELEKNPNVLRCSKKSITYSNDFKIAAIREWRTGLPPQKIFLQARFNLAMLGNETPQRCLRRWLHTFREKGNEGFAAETRGKGGGRPRKNWQNDKEKIKYLEAEVAYLKAENDFLAKLRKKS